MIELKADSLTYNITFGGHGEPAGNYRYALYATCDVYFVISTSLDNQELLSWDTVVCVRTNECHPHMDYAPESPDGLIFDNSPEEGKEITLSEDFYKTLPLPDEDDIIVTPGPEPVWPDSYETEVKTIRAGNIKRITDSGRFNQHYDAVKFDTYQINGKGIDLATMKQQGYKTITVSGFLSVREINDGYQYIMLYDSPDSTFGSEITGGIKGDHDGNWKTWEFTFPDVDINKFKPNEFIIRYGSSGFSSDSWENRDLNIQLQFKKQ